ncbi:MAG: hypothetical protein IJA73_04910 [Oscillospiraceae bacterium]|nr:hypothetical protein [Oscillospiraceae bacterium]
MPFPAFVDFNQPGAIKPQSIQDIHRMLPKDDAKSTFNKLDRIVRDHFTAQDERAGERFPEDISLISRYPEVDPKGMLSESDMSAASRLAAVRARLQTCDPSIRDYMKDAYFEVPAAITTFANMERTHMRMARLAPTREVYDMVRARYEQIKSQMQPFLDQAEERLNAYEYLVGLSDREPENVTDEERAMRSLPQYVPRNIEIPFADLIHQQQAKVLCGVDTWSLVRYPDDQPPIPTDLDPAQPEENAKMAANYMRGTVDRMISPLFESAERNTHGAVNRGDLIIIEGRTVREIMEERYRELQLPEGDFETYYQKNMKNAAKDLVGAALASDKRVEMYLPSKGMGIIPAEPTTVSRTGFKPDPVKQPEAFGAVKRFFMKFGFFKEEAEMARAQQEEYDRTMQARERVKERQLGIQRAMSENNLANPSAAPSDPAPTANERENEKRAPEPAQKKEGAPSMGRR